MAVPPDPIPPARGSGRVPDEAVPALDEALRRVGDRWSLLVVDALLGGPRRFGDLGDRVVGVSPNVLSRRLRDLEAAGVVASVPYSTRPLRHEYRLTPLGRELAPALAALSAWGERAGAGGASGDPSLEGADGSGVSAGPGEDPADATDDADEDVHYA